MRFLFFFYEEFQSDISDQTTSKEQVKPGRTQCLKDQRQPEFEEDLGEFRTSHWPNKSQGLSIKSKLIGTVVTPVPFQEGAPIQASIPLGGVGKCLLTSPPLGLQSTSILRASSHKMWGISGLFATITHPPLLPLSKHPSNCKFLILCQPGSLPSVSSLCFLVLYKPYTGCLPAWYVFPTMSSCLHSVIVLCELLYIIHPLRREVGKPKWELKSLETKHGYLEKSI